MSLITSRSVGEGHGEFSSFSIFFPKALQKDSRFRCWGPWVQDGPGTDQIVAFVFAKLRALARPPPRGRHPRNRHRFWAVACQQCQQSHGFGPSCVRYVFKVSIVTQGRGLPRKWLLWDPAVQSGKCNGKSSGMECGESGDGWKVE